MMCVVCNEKTATCGFNDYKDLCSECYNDISEELEIMYYPENDSGGL
jgi:hypothetical protein